MIPKIIHYCWLSDDPFPLTIEKCVNSWGKYLPDYEFVLWDKKRFDISSNIWVRQAYEKKKYAFAADYIRLYALYTYGGIYLDSDVQVLKTFDDLLELPYFLGQDSQGSFEAAVIGCEKNCTWVKHCLKYYDDRLFIDDCNRSDITTLPFIMQRIIQNIYNIITFNRSMQSNYKLDNNLYLFPFDFFCCKRSSDGGLVITENSYTIHHFSMSWRSPLSVILTKMKRLFVRVFGENWINVVLEIFSLRQLRNKLDR